jgi:hypothetical protein
MPKQNWKIKKNLETQTLTSKQLKFFKECLSQTAVLCIIVVQSQDCTENSKRREKQKNSRVTQRPLLRKSGAREEKFKTRQPETTEIRVFSSKTFRITTS